MNALSLLLFFCSSAKSSPPVANLFWEPDGNYWLAIEVSPSWNSAEIGLSGMHTVEYQTLPHDLMVISGKVHDLPSRIWVDMSLAAEGYGQVFRFSVPSIPMPASMPSLGGDESLPLPDLSWYMKRTALQERLRLCWMLLFPTDS
jgi:hypothetical protein